MNKTLLHIAIAMVLCVLSVSPCQAETQDQREMYAHELRVGWGDQLFETLCWREYTSSPGALLPDFTGWERTDFTYYQHLWLEYQYRVNGWLGLGAMVDGSGVSWQDCGKQYFYNITIMPTIRFTFVQSEYVSMYTGFGLGTNINSGTEKDLNGRDTAGSVAFNLTLLGIQAGYDRWFGAVEIGGMSALQSKDVVFMFGSRIFTASVGVHF